MPHLNVVLPKGIFAYGQTAMIDLLSFGDALTSVHQGCEIAKRLGDLCAPAGESWYVAY